MVTLTLDDGDTLTATALHPFWVMEGENLDNRSIPDHVPEGARPPGTLPGRWVDSHELQSGDVLWTQSTGQVRITAVDLTPTNRLPIYNLTVEETHTYLVGNQQVLVHNNSRSCPLPRGDVAKTGPADGAYDGVVFPSGKTKVNSLDREYPYSVFKMDERLMVKMRPALKQEPQNAAGFLRNAETYWMTMLRRHPEAFSDKNVEIIQGLVKNSDGKVIRMPKNDPTFRGQFKEYDITGLRGKPMVHHHIGGGAWAAGVPQPLHIGSGGIHVVEDMLGITIR